jgi:hypothetical protein
MPKIRNFNHEEHEERLTRKEDRSQNTREKPE